MELPNKSSIHRLVRIALFFAVGVILSFVESYAVPVGVLPAGVRLGLANIPVMLATASFSKREGLYLTTLKSLLAFMTRGITAGLLSHAGGLLSIMVLSLLLLFKQKTSCLLLGCCGSAAHGFGQLVFASVLTGTPYVFLHAPVLIGCSIATGMLTGSLFYLLLPHINAMFCKLED